MLVGSEYAKSRCGPFRSMLLWISLLTSSVQGEAETYLSNVPQCVTVIKSYIGKNESFADSKSGYFSSPNHPQPYSGKTHCRYDFVASSNERIKIAINDFNLYHPEDGNSRDGPPINSERPKDCGGADVLSAFDYVDDKLARIDDFCGSMTPLAVMSSGKKLTLEFDAPHSSRYVRGFTGQYFFVKDFGIRTGRQNITAKHGPCTFIFNSSETTNGTFTSPNYPGLYPRNTECHYLFYGKEGEYVELYFTYFHIDGVQPCDEDSHSDFVEFSNYMPVDRKFDRQCGTIKDLKMKSDRKFFRVTFRSNDRYDATGFHATYQFNNVANHLTIRNVRSGASGLRAGLLPFRKHKYLRWDMLRYPYIWLGSLCLSYLLTHLYSLQELSLSSDLDLIIYCFLFFLCRFRAGTIIHTPNLAVMDGVDSFVIK